MNSLRSIWIVCLLAVWITATVAADDNLRVDGERLNATMAKMKTFGGNAEGGSDRIAFSQHNLDALSYLAELMHAAGLTTHTDFAGNLIGRREGRESGLTPIVSGSHVDTVINGGHYDGIVGVMAAVEVAASLRDAGVTLDHPFEVAVWANEEAGKTGSRSMNGSIADRELALTALGDKTIGDGMRFLGGDPDRLAENVRETGSIAGYIELHVEQGATLDRDGIAIGVVDGIVGIRRWNITVDGFANHAGTTPMDQRKDSLYAAAQLIVAVRNVITGESGRQVGTVGRILTYPGAPNVIPGQTKLSLEIRDLDMEKIETLFQRVAGAADGIAEETDTSITIEQYYESPAALSDPRISEIVEQSAGQLELSARHMPSGAGHDAQSFKGIAPLAMIFVPSKDGVSHAPPEFTSEEQITDGANVLLQTVLQMDQKLR